MNTEQRKQSFISRAVQQHNDEYDYSKVVYTNTHTKVTLICKEHGEFTVLPVKHLQGQKCQKCSKRDSLKLKSKFKSFDQLVEHCNNIHNSAYEYNLLDFSQLVTTNDTLTIHCKKHGKFTQTINKHIYAHTGCPKCGTISTTKHRKKSTTQFISDAVNVQGNQYDYSLVNYVNAHTGVDIICKDHGPFNQTPANHILKQQGCPLCIATSPEKIIMTWLEEHNIQYIFQAKFDDCVNSKGNKLRYDFFLPRNNVLIEYDGIYHYKKVVHGGDIKQAHKRLYAQQLNDACKTSFAEKNNYVLFRIPYFSKTTIRNQLNIWLLN